MSKVTIHLEKLIQDSQEYGSDDEHMVSRVFFSLEAGGALHGDLYADVKQSVGGSFNSSPLEVSAPHGYEGSLNCEAFRHIIEDYYRSLAGAKGTGIHIGAGASNIRMFNNTFIQSSDVEIEGESSGGGW